MVIVLVWIEGCFMGLMVNSICYLGGVIDSDVVDKVSCFFQLCDVFGLFVFFFCDVFGFMVGL